MRQSGTTGAACLRSNRHYTLIERDPYYVKIARDRLQEKEVMSLEQRPEKVNR